MACKSLDIMDKFSHIKIMNKLNELFSPHKIGVNSEYSGPSITIN